MVAWAIPTIQIPAAFTGNPACVPSDAEVTRNLLSLALGSGKSSASMRLSSAYLNLTREMTSILSMYGRTGNNGDVGSSSSSSSPYILTAGAASHGFAPKVGSSSSSRGGKKRGVLERIKSTIPDAFLLLAKETARSIASSGGKILLYERQGWTFHAKGIWITAVDDDGDNGDDNDVDRSAPPPRCRHLDPRHHRPEIIGDPSSLLATVIGSSNFGSRSKKLDLIAS